MKISYNWLSSYFSSPLPKPEDISRLITMHSFEVESVEEKGKDYIFDFKVLPDRAHDALSHFGVAKELRLLTGIPFKSGMDHKREFPTTDRVKVSVENAIDTPRFDALLIENIKVGESAPWMKIFLEAIGQKSINNIVDATNLCMFHMGQPLHAYDTSKLLSKDGSWNIEIKKTTEEEAFTALGNKEYKLPQGTLVIRDANADKTLGIAGIKGGKASEIDESTTSIIIEAANFNPILIRKTSQKLRLRTDASERFEKEITPEFVQTALEDISALILELCPEAKLVGLVDVYPKHRRPFLLGVSTEEVNKKLGLNLTSTEIEAIFDRFGYEWKKVRPVDEVVNNAEKYLGVPYKYGSSISYDAPNYFDCAAFTNYLYAQAGVPSPRMTIDQFAWAQKISKEELIPGDLIFSNNGHEEDVQKFNLVTGEAVEQKTVHTHSKEIKGFVIEGGVEHVGIYLGDNKVIHASGLSNKGMIVIEDLDESNSFKDKICGYRRFSNNDERYVITVPSERLDMVARRAFLVSGNKEDLIEEIGRVYGYENIASKDLPETSFKPKNNKTVFYADKIRDELIEDGYSEVQTYAFVEKGEVELENPLASDKKFLRDSILPALKKAYEFNKRNIDLLGQKEIKIFEIGKVFKSGKEILMLAKFPDNTEIDLEELISKEPEPNNSTLEHSNKDEDTKIFKPFSVYPFIVRDIALFVPEGTEPKDVESIFTPILTDLCVRKTLFDSFLKSMPDGTKKQSYAWRFVFQSKERTLTDLEVNDIMEKITATLKENTNFEIR